MRYALLIGINSYAHNPLKGCVHDVQEVKICLEQRSPGVKVFMMTATCAENADPRQLVENPSDWPTYDNIHSTLKLIATEAKPGDFVYIHYSGHGTRIPPSEFNGNSGDVALALLAGDRGQRVNYLHGFELAYLINKIVSIGCEATVVLDCCFSGGVSRHDNDDGGRSLVYDIGIDMASPRPSAGARAYMRAGRNTSLLPEWIINPDKYNILAACGPHEVAREIELRDRTRHGALSYFLLKLLNSNGIKEGSIDDVYGQLLASFRQNFRQQSPVLFGKQSLRFFDSSMAGTLVKSIAVIGTTASRLYLNGGQAHGLSNGDVFVLVSCHRTDKSKDFQTAGSTFGRIINAKGLTSEIEVIDGPPDTKAFRAGWIAMPKNQPSLLRYRTHFQVTSTQQATWIEACSHRLSLNATFSEVADPSAAFTVIVGDTNSYEVRDANLQRSFERPRIPPGEDCLQEVVNTIEQLAWYHHVRSIENTTPSMQFLNSFSIKIMDQAGRSWTKLNIQENIQRYHNDWIIIELENQGNHPLYLHLYSLGPYWEITNILRKTYETIPIQDTEQGFSGISRRKLRATIPSSMIQNGQEYCEDTIKIFITSQPTSISWLERNKIGFSGRAEGSSHSAPTSIKVITSADSHLDDWVVYNLSVRTLFRH